MPAGVCVCVYWQIWLAQSELKKTYYAHFQCSQFYFLGSTRIDLHASVIEKTYYYFSYCTSLFTLCLNHSAGAPVCLSLPLSMNPVCSDWLARRAVRIVLRDCVILLQRKRTEKSGFCGRELLPLACALWTL